MKRDRHPEIRLAAYLLMSLGVVALLSGAARAADTPREKADGIGGFFFRAHDPKALAKWYEDNFGITPPSNTAHPPWQQAAGTTAFTPFGESSTYFDRTKPFELNFRVHDLDKMVAQLRAAGIVVTVDPQTYPYGPFAHLKDPEGNPIELWQPITPPNIAK
jgi:predicted enzyme related to lactoylglutathione lyase